MLMIFSVISINSVFAEDPPLILSKVEIWGPSSFIANNVNFCMDNTVGQLGPWAVGWIEIQNTKDKTITAENITLSDSALRSILPITLKAKESCIFQTEDQITTRIGPGGSGGNGPPYGYDGSIVVFDYTVEENGKKIPYVDTTPKISDIFGDTRIWQLVDDEWLFKEGSIGNVLQETNGVSISPDKTVYPVPWENRPPLKQFKSGIAVDKITCKENLYLAYKSSDGAPACVKLETGKKLLERGFAKCMETKTEYSRVNLCGLHSSVDGNPNPAQETNSHFNSQKIQNKFPNVAQRQVVMKIEDQKLQDGALGVTIIDKIIRTEPSDDVVYIEIVKQWENFKIPEPMFFNITLEDDDTHVSKPFLIQQSLMESQAGPLKDQFYFSLPINVPLLAKAKQGVILFNYTMPDVLPKDEKYHLKFASFSDVEVKLPRDAIIIENNTREYSEFWSYDKDAFTHKVDYITISYQGNNFDVNNVIIYDIIFEIRK